jgi:predicted metal-dependent hydrolase
VNFRSWKRRALTLNNKAHELLDAMSDELGEHDALRGLAADVVTATWELRTALSEKSA